MCNVGRIVNWCSHYRKQYGESSKLKIELSYDPAIPYLGIGPNKNTKSRRPLHSHVHRSITYSGQHAETT